MDFGGCNGLVVPPCIYVKKLWETSLKICMSKSITWRNDKPSLRYHLFSEMNCSSSLGQFHSDWYVVTCQIRPLVLGSHYDEIS